MLYASTNGTGFNPTGPLFATVIANTNVSPTAAGRPVGFSNVLVTDTSAVEATCGTSEVEGGTGMPLVVVGIVTTALLPLPELTAVNRAVITVEPPTPNGPTFAHVIVPAPRFVAVAGGVCDKIASRFVRYVSTTGTVSSVTSPVFTTAIENTIVSPTAAGRPVGFNNVFVMLTPGATAA